MHVGDATDVIALVDIKHSVENLTADILKISATGVIDMESLIDAVQHDVSEKVAGRAFYGEDKIERGWRPCARRVA